MSVDSTELEKILAEDFEDDEITEEEIQEKIEEIIVEPSPPYIYISLPNSFYVAGDRLEGEILIDVPTSLGSSELNLSSQGIEEIHIFQQSKHTSQNSNKVFSLNTPITTWENLPKGHYCYPFTFKIPHHSPPTFFYSGQDLTKNFIRAQVSYTLCAKLIFGGEEISHSCNLYIRSKEYYGNPRIEVEATENIVELCCMNK